MERGRSGAVGLELTPAPVVVRRVDLGLEATGLARSSRANAIVSGDQLIRYRLIPLAAAVALTAAGCSANAAPPQQQPVAGPTTIDNCGFEVSLDSPPERILTIKSTSTEMLLALGLGERIIGTAFPDGPVPEQWLAEAAHIPVVSDFAPSQEAVLELEPDFVYGGWESNFTAETAGERAALAGFGIGSYVSPAACKGEGYQPDKLTFDHIFNEIEQAGDIFGAADAAAALVEQQRAELASITPDDRQLTALWYSSGTKTPYVGAGIGAPQLVMDTLGLENIAGAVDDTWASYNWEAVIDANPDVIVLVDAAWNTAASKKELFANDPVLSQLDAVKHERYLIVAFSAAEAGVRSVPATADLARQLHELDLP